MRQIMVFLLVLTAVAGTVNAAFWNAGGDEAALWSNPDNWDPVGVPDITTKVQFSRDMAECIIDFDAASGQLVLGDNGPDNIVHELTIVDGGSLVCGGTAWAASGYNRSSIVTVQQGGFVESVTRFGVGLVAGPSAAPQTSQLVIDGGEMIVRGNLQIGSTDHTGIVRVNSGLLEVTGTLEFRNPAVSFIDIKYGTLIVNGDRTALVADQLDNDPPNITGFGGEGTVVYDYNITNPGQTTITAIHPMDPSPLSVTLPEGEVELSWTNLDPNSAGDSVWVDVWFGTDPNKMNSEKYTKVITAAVAGENATSVPVIANVIGDGPTTYYWQVDSYIYGNPAEGVIESEVWSFQVSNDTPPVNISAGGNVITWIGKETQLTGTYEDDGKSTVKETWSTSDPGVIFSPSSDGGVTGDGAVVTVTIDNAGTVTLIFEVQDELNDPVLDDMTATVYEDACQAARTGANLGIAHPGDFTGPDGVPDCVINLLDFAELAAQWLNDYTLPGPISLP